MLECAEPEAAPYHIAVEAAPASAGSERDLGAALRQLWRRRWLVAMGAGAGAAIAAAVVWSLPTLYVAEARLLVGINGPRMLDVETLVADIGPDAERVQNESFILQSRVIARQVIDQLHLAQDPNFNPELRPSPWRYVRRVADLLHI